MARIEGLVIEIGADAKKFQSEIRGLDKSIGKTKNSLSQVGKALKFNPGNADLIRQKQQLLGKQIDNTKTKLTRLKQEEEKLKSADGFDENSEDAQRLQREIIETESKLKSLNRQASKVSTVFGTQLQAAGDKIKAFGTRISRVGDTLTRSLTVPIAGAAAVATKKFAEVDKTMQLTNETMGNTEAEARMISDAMKDAASNSTFGMNDAATASLNFARAGLSASQAAATLAPALNLAAGEGGTLDTVSSGLVATINGFSDTFDSASKYADVFANACNNSALDIDSLSSAMSVAAPVFSAAGYKVEDAALYMGVMANKGIEANKAANSLKTGISRLVKPTDEAAGYMKKLGISVTNSDGSMKDSVTIQKELHNAFKDLSESEQIAAASAIFGKNQMSPWLALINTAPEDVNKLADALDKEGTTSEMASAMMSGFGGSIEKLKSSIDVAATSLGEALAPTIKKVSDKIQAAVDAFNALDEGQQQTIAKVGLMVAAAGPLLSVGGRLISGIGSLVSGLGRAINVVGSIVSGTASLTSVFGLGAAAALALVGGMYALYKSGEKAQKAQYDLTKEEKEHVEALNSARDAYAEVDEARKEASTQIVSEAEYAHDLVNEYNGLIDSNGQVKEGYESRSEFIKGQLAEAMGIEKSQIDGLIDKNGKLKASVDDLIESKKAEALLDANKDAYAKAVEERKTAVEKLAPAMRELQSNQEEYSAALEKVSQREKEYNKAIESGGNATQAKMRLENAKTAAEGAAEAVEKQKKAVEGYKDTLSKANTEISNYEGLAAAIEAKDTKAIQSWSQKLTTGIKTRENSTREELRQQAKAINEEYELIEKAYKNHEAGITEQMVADAKKRRDAADKEAGIDRKEAKKRGENTAKAEAEGLSAGGAAVKGAGDKLREIVSGVLSKTKGDAQSSSKGIKDAVTNNTRAAANNANASFTRLKNSASANMSGASSAVDSNVKNIKGKFPFSLGKMFSGYATFPRVTASIVEKVKGLAKVLFPSITTALSTIHFAKAYDNPMLFTSPTLYGGAVVGDRGSHAGGEMIYGRDNLMRDIQAAVGGQQVINVTVNGAQDPRQWAHEFIDEYKLATRAN